MSKSNPKYDEQAELAKIQIKTSMLQGTLFAYISCSVSFLIAFVILALQLAFAFSAAPSQLIGFVLVVVVPIMVVIYLFQRHTIKSYDEGIKEIEEDFQKIVREEPVQLKFREEKEWAPWASMRKRIQRAKARFAS